MIVPPKKPRATRKIVLGAAYSWWRRAFPKVPFEEPILFGVRNYYTDSFDPGGSGRGRYDDAIFIIGTGETFAGFNANTDPSAFRRGVATLIPGWYPYRPGKHGISRPGGGYPAFRPATKDEALPVYRDGETGRSKRDGIAINIHRGGWNTTSSAGCQTIHPSQWDAFYSLARLEMKRAGINRVWYGLIDGPIV